MKQYLALLLAVWLAYAPALCWALPSFLFHKRSAFAADTACVTTNTALVYDHFLEGFQTTTTGINDGNVWTVGAAIGDGTVDPYYDTSALTTNKPAGACDRAWRVVLPTNGTETYQVWDRGSSYTMGSAVMKIHFHLYVETAPDAGEDYVVFRYGSSTSSTGYGFSMSNVAGTLQVLAFGQTNTAAIPINTGEWIKVLMYLDTSSAGATSYLQINDGTPEYYQRNTQSPRYLTLGPAAGLVSGESGTFLIDLIAIEE
jgi:hypothetical protein